jgi:hypothetical protein
MGLDARACQEHLHADFLASGEKNHQSTSLCCVGRMGSSVQIGLRDAGLLAEAFKEGLVLASFELLSVFVLPTMVFRGAEKSR